MSKRRATRHNRCPVCHINERLCFCDRLIPIETKTTITILIHVSELSSTSNTGTLAHKLLTNSTIKLRGGIDKRNEPLTLETPESYAPYFLFPDDDAQILTPEFAATLTGPIHLIVPDGSWRQAKRFKRREPSLAGVPSLVLPDLGPSQYQLRKEPGEHSLCTIEAISRALGILEGDHVRTHLDSIFDIMVERTLLARSGKHQTFLPL